MNSNVSQADEIRSPIIASWVLLIATCVLAVIPIAGFLAWIIGGVTITIAIILAIVAIAKGGTWSGIFVLLVALIVVPCVVIFAPIVSTVITAAILDEKNGGSIEMSTEAPEKAIDPAEEADATASELEHSNEAEAIESIQEASEAVRDAESAPAISEPTADPLSKE